MQMVLFPVLFQRGVQARRSAGPGAEGLEAPLGFVTWAWHTRGDGPLIYAGHVSKEPTAGEGLLTGRQVKVLYVPRKRRTWWWWGGRVPASFQLVFTAAFFDLFLTWGFPGGALVKNLPANVGHARERGSIPGSGSPGERNGNHSSVFAGESHGQKSPVGYSPWSCKELDITE